MGLAYSSEEPPIEGDTPKPEEEKVIPLAAFFETKYQRKTACSVAWTAEHTEICTSTKSLRFLWKDTLRVCVQPLYSQDSLVVFDCVPEGESVPMLVKVWLPRISSLEVLKKGLDTYNSDAPKKVKTGKSMLWSSLFSTTMLPYYRRWMNDVYKWGCGLLEVLVVVVTVFALMDLLNLGEPGLSDSSFYTKAAEAFKIGETNYDLMQSMINKDVALLSREDRAIVNERWKDLGWSTTFVDNRVIFRQEEALQILRPRDYLQTPREFLYDSVVTMVTLDYIGIIMAHPIYCLMCVPFLLTLGIFFLFSASGLGLLLVGFLGMQFLVAEVLSLKVTMVLRTIVYDLRTIVSQTRSMTQKSVGLLRLLYSQFKKGYKKMVTKEDQRPKKVEKSE